MATRKEYYEATEAQPQNNFLQQLKIEVIDCEVAFEEAYCNLMGMTQNTDEYQLALIEVWRIKGHIDTLQRLIRLYERQR